MTQVYLTATGGNPGLAVANPNLAEMVVLGPCSALTAATFVQVNELTTVAATSALAPYMTSLTAVGSGTSDATALANAFALAGEYVSTSTGTSPGLGVPAGVTVPVAELDTLANVLAACINSPGGTAGDGSACGNLFAMTTPPNATAPTTTVGAALNVAANPTMNTAGLFGLAAAVAPFQPVLTAAPSDFSVRLQPLPGMAALTVSPAGLSFTKTAVGFAASLGTVTVTNTGTGAVTITSVALTGVSAGDYAQTNTCPSSLAAGANCTVTVTFTPLATGVRDAALVVASSAPGSPQTVALSGVGVRRARGRSC